MDNIKLLKTDLENEKVIYMINQVEVKERRMNWALFVDRSTQPTTKTSEPSPSSMEGNSVREMNYPRTRASAALIATPPRPAPMTAPTNNPIPARPLYPPIPIIFVLFWIFGIILFGMVVYVFGDLNQGSQTSPNGFENENIEIINVKFGEFENVFENDINICYDNGYYYLYPTPYPTLYPTIPIVYDLFWIIGMVLLEIIFGVSVDLNNGFEIFENENVKFGNVNNEFENVDFENDKCDNFYNGPLCPTPVPTATPIVTPLHLIQ